jgi:hypothetical protein
MEKQLKSRFLPDGTIRAAIAASYLIAFIYTYAIESANIKIWQTIFVFLFCAGSLLLNHSRKVSIESWIWLLSIAVITVSGPAGRNQIWGEISWPLLHAYAIYWILNRSGKMVAGRSSGFFLLDVINGVLIIPFGNFILRSKLIWSGFQESAQNKERHSSKFGSLIAIVVALVLLIAAGSLLSAADQVFGQYIGNFFSRFDTEMIRSVFVRAIFSLPVGAYLFGLVTGSEKEDRQVIVKRGESVSRLLESIRQVPANIWNILVSIFVILYLAFFIIQGSYLFGAFSGSLPADFTIANYARRGFFELCLIMALNFSLLWIVGRSSKPGIRENAYTKVISTLILIESILFSITAFSKIYFYILSYGFTPLRWQSSWLVAVLFAGCVTALISIWTGRQTSRYWIIFSGVTLALTHLY